MNRKFWIPLLMLLTLLLLPSCSATGDIGIDPEHDPQAYADQPKDGKAWRMLEGAALELPDLIEPWMIEAYGEDNRPIPGPDPYFGGEITELHEDYMVVKIRTDLVRAGDKVPPSYAQELLKCSDSCIVPFWLYTKEMGEYRPLSAEEFAVGDLIDVRFETGRVSTDTVYGDALVIRVANNVCPLEQ